MNKTIEFIKGVQKLQMGNNLVLQPFPSGTGYSPDPFLLLHHWGPTMVHAGEQGLQVDPHPHRGFMPVTLMLRGEVSHQDSRGYKGIAKAGDVQWFNSGRGIIHSERSPSAFLEKGGEIELLQLWINLPADQKMSQPTYDLIYSEDIPVVPIESGVNLHLVSGVYQEIEGPAKAHSPLLIGRVEAEADKSFKLKVPTGFQATIYVISGEIGMNEEWYANTHQWVKSAEEGSDLDIHTTKSSHLLIMAGKPLNEPVAWNGPFVMNTETQVLQAMRDYQMGKMGVLIEDRI
jgi:redox-sensitive bicupin YhaK (pirin superfamily)